MRRSSVYVQSRVLFGNEETARLIRDTKKLEYTNEFSRLCARSKWKCAVLISAKWLPCIYVIARSGDFSENCEKNSRGLFVRKLCVLFYSVGVFFVSKNGIRHREAIRPNGIPDRQLFSHLTQLLSFVLPSFPRPSGPPSAPAF